VEPVQIDVVGGQNTLLVITYAVHRGVNYPRPLVESVPLHQTKAEKAVRPRLFDDDWPEFTVNDAWER